MRSPSWGLLSALKTPTATAAVATVTPSVTVNSIEHTILRAARLQRQRECWCKRETEWGWVVCKYAGAVCNHRARLASLRLTSMHRQETGAWAVTVCVRVSLRSSTPSWLDSCFGRWQPYRPMRHGVSCAAADYRNCLAGCACWTGEHSKKETSKSAQMFSSHESTQRLRQDALRLTAQCEAWRCATYVVVCSSTGPNWPGNGWCLTPIDNVFYRVCARDDLSRVTTTNTKTTSAVPEAIQPPTIAIITGFYSRVLNLHVRPNLSNYIYLVT